MKHSAGLQRLTLAAIALFAVVVTCDLSCGQVCNGNWCPIPSPYRRTVPQPQTPRPQSVSSTDFQQALRGLQERQDGIVTQIRREVLTALKSWNDTLEGVERIARENRLRLAELEQTSDQRWQATSATIAIVARHEETIAELTSALADRPPQSGSAGPDLSTAAAEIPDTETSGDPAVETRPPAADPSAWFGFGKLLRAAALVMNLTTPHGQVFTMASTAVGVLSWFAGKWRERRQDPQHRRLKEGLRRARDELEVSRAQGVSTQTKFVQVKTNDPEGEAYKEALRRIVEKNPQHKPLIQLIISTAQQLLHGHRVTEAEREGRPADGAGLFWKDES